MRRSIERVIPIIIGLICFGQVWKWSRAPQTARDHVRVTATVTSSLSDEYELFYDSTGLGFGPEWSARGNVIAELHQQEVVFDLPSLRSLHGLRFDPGGHAKTVSISRLSIEGPYRTLTWGGRDILDHFIVFHDLDSVRFSDVHHALLADRTGDDPYLATKDDLEPLFRRTLSHSRPILGPLLLAMLAGVLTSLLTGWIMKWGTLQWTGLRPTIQVTSLGVVLVAISCAIIFLLVRGLVEQVDYKDNEVSFLVAGGFHRNDEAQIYHARKEGEFTQERTLSHPIVGHPGTQLLRFVLPKEQEVRYLRFDPGMMQEAFWIDSISLMVDDRSMTWRAGDLPSILRPNEQISSLRQVNGRWEMAATGKDPNFILIPDLGPVIDDLREGSGKGPIPIVLASLASLFFLFGTGRRLAVLRLDPSRRAKDLGLTIVFAALVFAPLVVTFSDLEPDLANTEKRLLAEKPPYTLARTLVYPTEFTRYYEENFGLRKLYFRWQSLFMSKVIGTSPLPEKVIFGKEDWMFYMQPRIIAKYEGRCDLTLEQLRSITDRLEKRRQWLERQGIDYVLMFPPEKSVVYPDKLPWRIKRFDEPSCLDLLKQEISERTRLRVVDIRKELIAGREFGEVYYTSDTHWNPVGAWFGYCGLMNAIRSMDSTITPPVPFNRFRIEHEVNPMGDLAELMGLADAFPRSTPHMIPLDLRHARDTTISPSVARFTRYSPIIKHVPGSKAPRLLMFRDSFAVYMIPYLSEHFSRSSFVWTPIFFHEVVAEERPDIIVHEVMELFISDLLQDDREVPEELFPVP